MKNQGEIEGKLQELQILEQNLQAILMQKQAFQLELNQTENAIAEVSNTNDEVYKMTGSIMIKTDKSTVLEELKNKQKILGMRINALEKQEKLISAKSEELKKETQKILDKK